MTTPNLLWSYGVTTVPDRLESTLPITLRSLRNGGFPKPRLFIDGVDITDRWRRFNLPITPRWPKVGAMQNWILSLSELYYREPKADRFTIFQDDIICSSNLRQYLELCIYPENGYLNLYTVPINQEIATNRNHPIKSIINVGWFPSNQRGKGALALVFNQSTVRLLLSSQYIMKKVLDTHKGHKNIDGAVITVMRDNPNQSITEWCHSPSLVQHIGNNQSTLNNHPKDIAPIFNGERFNCLDFISKS
jgi:hypothetical protein